MTVRVDLPAPDSLRNRWAAVAAMLAALEFGEPGGDCNADGGDWFFHDGGGNWMQLIRFADGRAAFVGSDHEYSDTYFRSAAGYFGEPETDLLAGGPGWWETAYDLRASGMSDESSWLYAWDGASWTRADYEESDGFSSVFALGSDDEVAATITEYTGASRPDALAVIAAGADVTADLLSVLGESVVRPRDGVTIASAFSAPGRH